ncbi:hypothetical protein ACOSP7_010017 [Xanthoceras sorbifolium]
MLTQKKLNIPIFIIRNNLLSTTKTRNLILKDRVGCFSLNFPIRILLQNSLSLLTNFSPHFSLKSISILLWKDAEIWSVQKKEGTLALVNIVQEQKKDEVLNIANLKYEQEQLEDDTGKIGNIGEALKIRNDMVSKGMSSNAVTFNSLIQSFCKSGQMDHAKNVLEEMLSSDLPITQGAYTSVVHWLCINSRFDSALRFIKKMLLRNLRPGEGLLTLLVGGLCKTGKHTEAIELWFRLLEKGIAANTVTSNALIHGLCELGDMQKAVKLLKEMLQKSLGLDKITYNTLILSFCREGKLEEAFKLKGDMIKRRFQPEIYTYGLLLHGFYSMLTDKIRDNNLDQRRSRFGLARMIILHGYPLTTVEDVGFRVGVKNLQPLFELVTCRSKKCMKCWTNYLAKSASVLMFGLFQVILKLQVILSTCVSQRTILMKIGN